MPNRSSLARAARPTPGIFRRSPANDDHAQSAWAGVGAYCRSQLFHMKGQSAVLLAEAGGDFLCLIRRTGMQDRAHFD